jgi:hypothetical protein
MLGQIVVCKDFMGKPLVRKVWEDSEALIFIHTEDQFQAHELGLPHLETVGFPVSDVFIHEDRDLTAERLWDELKPYIPADENAAPEGGRWIMLDAALSR